VATLPDGRRKKLHRGAAWSRYLPSGHLIYLHRGSLFAMPFHLDRLEPAGTPVPVLEGVSQSTLSGVARFDFSLTGTAVYEKGGGEQDKVTIQWLDSAGKTAPLLAKPGIYTSPRLSPDGRLLALSETTGGNYDVWVYDLQRDTMTRLTFDPQRDEYPVWTPDGRHIVYLAGTAMAMIRADGAGKPQPLTESRQVQRPFSFTPDGKRLAFVEGWDLWTLPLEGGPDQTRAGKPEPFLKSRFQERSPAFSADGKWLAYESNETGRAEIFVRSFPDSGAKWQISSGGGAMPVFSRNGRELFYRTFDSRIMVTPYRVSGGSFVADKPRLWSEKRFTTTGFFPNFDPAPDGKRFAVLMPGADSGEQKPRSQVTFLFNFFDELRRKVPPGGGAR
jgi:hypothetical protein